MQSILSRKVGPKIASLHFTLSADSYTIYDAQILAAAGKAGCARLWSEDMHHGHRVEAFGMRVEIGNPFDNSDQS